MKRSVIFSAMIGGMVALTCHTSLQAAPLSPDDVSVSGSLQLWLRNPGTDFNGTTWLDSSGNGRHAVAAGSDAVGTASTVTSGAGSYTGQTFDSVFFAGSINDLMVSSNLNGGAGSSDWTIFGVHATNGTAGNDRPLGIGAWRIGPTTGLLNLANDGSLRFDNGSNLGGAIPNSSGDVFLRSVRLDSGSMSQWYDATIDYLNDNTASSGSIPNPTNDDDFYFGGDMRATNLDSDTHLVEMVVYNGALTDAQIDGINEYLLAIVQPPSASAIPEPSSFVLAAMAIAGMAIGRRRRRRG